MKPFKLKPFKLNAMVLIPKAVNQMPITGQDAKKCREQAFRGLQF